MFEDDGRWQWQWLMVGTVHCSLFRQLHDGGSGLGSHCSGFPPPWSRLPSTSRCCRLKSTFEPCNMQTITDAPFIFEAQLEPSQFQPRLFFFAGFFNQ